MPNKTEPAETTKNTLPSKINVSRELRLNFPPRVFLGARHAYKASEEPTTSDKKIKIKMPRFGSVAKAWTEVNTPERTKNVPSNESEKAVIAKSTVQLLKPPRFSVTAKECSKAVPTSQGINEAFSTGSQNHHPPQPNS